MALVSQYQNEAKYWQTQYLEARHNESVTAAKNTVLEERLDHMEDRLSHKQELLDSEKGRTDRLKRKLHSTNPAARESLDEASSVEFEIEEPAVKAHGRNRK